MSNINLQDLDQINQLSQDDINVIQPQWNELFFSKNPLNSTIQQHVERKIKKQKIVEKVRGQNIQTSQQYLQTTVQNLQTTVQNIHISQQNLQTTVQNIQTDLISFNQRLIRLENDRIRKSNHFKYNNELHHTPELLYKEIEGIGDFPGHTLQQFTGDILNANVGSRPTQNIHPILDTLRDRYYIHYLTFKLVILLNFIITDFLNFIITDLVIKLLLKKMNWSDGEGLGKDNQGKINPIKVEKKNNKLGLGKLINNNSKNIIQIFGKKKIPKMLFSSSSSSN
ncbi:hypothetical protein ACTFIR_001025 [Dictyostelium discoideum]